MPSIFESPLKKARELLKTVSGVPNLNLDAPVDALLKASETKLERQYDWISAVKTLERDEGETVVKDFIDNLVSNVSHVSHADASRVARYEEYISITKKFPILKKMLRVYAANILSPDDITKASLKIMPDKYGEDIASKLDDAIKNMQTIVTRLKIDEHAYKLIYKTLHLGDMFVEIINSKQYLIQTLYNMGIPLKESSIGALNELNTSRPVQTFDIESGRSKFRVTLDETIPLHEQFVRFQNATESLCESAVEALRETTMTFTLKSKQIPISSPTGSYSPEGVYALPSDKPGGGKDMSIENMRHLFDQYPTKGSISNISLKFIDPWNIIVIEHDDIVYGYVYFRKNDMNMVQGSANSQTSSTQTINRTTSFGTATGGESSREMENVTKQLTNQFVTKMSDYIRDKFGINSYNIDNMRVEFGEIMADILISGNPEVQVRFIPCANIHHFKIDESGTYAPYGESRIDDLMFRARLLLADDIAGVVYKLSKTGKRTVFYVKSPSQKAAKQRIMDVKTSVNKRAITLDKVGSTDMLPSLVSSEESYYIPDINGERQIEIDTLELGTYSDHADPNMYMLKQLLTGGDIPPPHLGYEEWVNAKATLTSENVVLARNIIALQKEFSDMFSNLVHKIYVAIYMDTNEFNPEFRHVRVTFLPPRSLMLSVEAEKAQSLDTLVDSLKNIGVDPKAIVQMYWPELLDIDMRITKAVGTINEKRKSGGNAGVNDMFGGDMGMGNMGGSNAVAGGKQGGGDAAGGSGPAGAGGGFDIDSFLGS